MDQAPKAESQEGEPFNVNGGERGSGINGEQAEETYYNLPVFNKIQTN